MLASDAVWALLHRLEDLVEETTETEDDDFLEGVRSGVRAERKRIAECLREALTEPEEWYDLDADPELLRQLNPGVDIPEEWVEEDAIPKRCPICNGCPNCHHGKYKRRRKLRICKACGCEYVYK